MSDHEPDRSPIVANLARVLDFIQKRSILYLLLRWRGLHDQDRFVDRYVMACTVLAPCMYLASFVPLPLTLLKVGLAAILIFVSAWRIIELVTFHLNMLIARPGRPGGVSSVASYERTFIFALANYLEVTFWFATWYSIAVRQGAFQEVQGPLLLSIFRESLAMMLVNSSGLFKPRASWCLWAAICFQSVVGLFLTLLVLARAVAMLPPPEEDKKKSQKDGQNFSRSAAQPATVQSMMSNERQPAVKVVRSNGTDEVLARAVNTLIARGAYREAARMYPEDLIELRQGARIIEKSKP